MSDRPHIGLDNVAFTGRLRQYPLPVRIEDVRYTAQTAPQPAGSLYPRPRLVIPVSEQKLKTPKDEQQSTATMPIRQLQQRSHVLKRPLVTATPAQSFSESPEKPKKSWWQGKLQFGIVGVAAVLFLLAIAANVQTIKTTHQATAQVSALTKKTAESDEHAAGSVVPSVTKPSAAAIAAYTVTPDDPRYLKIPKLGVDARVQQVGVTSTGALGTPDNVYDAAWYTASAKPGQPGATLIDGHVSSWTTHGVFYGLKTLAAGDAIQIERGDGTVINYRVVKTQTYNANNVNMQAAVTPITPGTSGLNLITCTGDVIRGTSLFNQRIIVFAQEV